MEISRNDEDSTSVMQSISNDQEQPMNSVLNTKDVEDMYAQKLQDLYERSATLQRLTHEQFVSAMKEAAQQEPEASLHSPICEDLQAKVLECYQANPGEILNCSAMVNAFTACVNKTRLDVTLSNMKEVKLMEAYGKIAEANGLLKHPEVKK